MSMSTRPEVWSDGSLVMDSVTGVSAAGAGVFAHHPETCWGDRRWSHVDCVQSVGVDHSCRAFVSVPGPLQTIQRAELWEVILALQSADAVHVGVDNLGVVRHVGRLLDGGSFSLPLELVTDGDLLVLIRRMIDLRGSNTVRVTKVKGHADEGLVAAGRVRELDRLGNNAADEAADFGRGRVGPAVLYARRNLSGVCGRWYPVILDLHRFFIAISRAVVNHDGFGGTAPDPMVWSAGSMPKRRRLVHAVRDLALLPGPPAIWLGEWVAGPSVAIGADDVAQCLTLLVFWLSGFLFLEVSTGLLVVLILGLVVFLMWSCSSCTSFGLVRDFPWKKLTLAIFVQDAQFQCRLFLLVQALIFGALVVLLVLL